MSKFYWKEQLARALKKTPPAKAEGLTDSGSIQARNRNAAPRVAIVGIGNELNGDDAAGVLAARALHASLKASSSAEELDSGVLIIEAGPAPENFTGPLRRFQPDLVLLVDAADFGAAPGTITWIDWQEVDGLSASTHTLPPTVFSEFLIHELGCEIGMIGIQASQMEFDQPPSPFILAAVLELAREMVPMLQNA